MAWTIAAFAAAGWAFAFDSGKWLSERGDDSDAVRLREVYDRRVPEITQPAENVVFPIETNPDGTIKSRLRAGKAYVFLDAGFVWGADVVVEQYEAGGKTATGTLTADNCIVDRKTKTGWVPGNAKIVWGETSVAGRGVHFDLGREYVKIFANTRIESDALGGKGVKDALGGVAPREAGKKNPKPAAAGGKKKAEIVAERTDYDHKEGVVLFDRNVHLDDAEYQMATDRLFVFLEGTNSLRRLVALGNVAITNGTKRARCAKAAYVRKTGKIDLYGDERAKARLEDVGGKKAAVEGDRVTFWADSEQVEVEDAAVFVPAFGKSGKKGLGL